MSIRLRRRSRAAFPSDTACALSLALLTAAVAAAQPQSKDQRKCIGGLNGSFAQIAAAASKNAAACIANGSKGELADSIDACVAGDADGKLAKAVTGGEKKFAALCTGTSKKPPSLPKLPPYGATDVAAVAAAAAESSRALVADIFGDDLNAAILRESADKDAAKCQQSIVKRAGKCAAAHVRGFNACTAAGLKNETSPFNDAADLASCMGDDPKGKIAKQCNLTGGDNVDAIRTVLDKKCRAKDVSLAAAVPSCTSDDLEATHACIESAVRCRVCLGLNRADDLTRDCDVFDDGTANESCVAPFVIGRHQCVLTEETGGFILETATAFHSAALSGHVQVECGVVDPSTGTAPCACNLLDLDPVQIVPNIGVACVRPASGCALGEISCNGGALYNSAIATTHDIGACSGSIDCAVDCGAHCSAAGAMWFESNCEGFCRGGSNLDAACTTDAECPGGTCNGLDGAQHGNACQCACIDVSGDPSRPGGLRCNLPIDVTVEMATPCGDGDVLFEIGVRCVPLTTETAQAVILDANDVAGAQIPDGLEINGGSPLPCSELAADGPSGMFLVSATNVLDVELAGDMAFTFLLGCR